MTWGLVGVGIRSTSWMRPGSPRRHLGICLPGVVFLVVFVRHLFLGDLVLVFSFSLCCLCLVSMFGLSCGSPFSYVVIYCVITVVCLGFFFGSGSLGGFLLVFLVLGKVGIFLFFFCCYIWSWLYLFVLNILSCYQVGSLVRLC